jgi:eukaryotic-like serine/threonine-protein kinase
MRASHLPTARLTPAKDEPSDATAATRGARSRGPAPLVLERYRLHRRLGAGAFGTVWMARDERLERDVAVKILPRERIVSGRFEREARAAARLAHPGIVTLYEAAADDHGAYLVSELVRGPTLAELLEAGRLSDRDIIAIAIALCDALSHAHAEGIIHRDVKPSNVLIPERPSTPAGLAKLTDFGVARVIGGDSLTRTGDVIGSAAYMAPEQAEGLEAGAPADLYALALVTYEALTGVNPVRTGTAARRARRLGAHLPPLRRQRRELPRELGCAIDLALRPRPRERGNLDELRHSLAQSLPLMQDVPGVVSSSWPATAERERESAHRRSDEPDVPGDPLEPRRPREPAEIRAGAGISWPARALAALAAAAAAGWLSAHLLAPSPVTPAAAALLAAILVASLPRVGWLALTGAMIAAAAIGDRPGAALILALAASIPIALVPRTGTAWPLAAGAPALGLVGLAGAWPALAARVAGPWRRAVLGATGWIWLLLAAPVYGSGLYLKHPAGTSRAATHWMSSLDQTAQVVLRPILSSGALAAAPVWAIAALVLPWLVRRRSLPVQIVLVSAWAAAVVSATDSAIGMVHFPDRLAGSAVAAVGAVAGALVALAPSAVEAVRVGRARAGLP